MKPILVIRVYVKLFLNKTLHIDMSSFCKHCGCSVRDFVVSDDVWDKVQKHIKRGNTLCYNCFSDICERVGLFPVWKLEKLD